MRAWRTWLMAGALLPGVSASAINPLERSISNSRQFIVYCDDMSLRHKVATFAEEVKSDALKLIGESGRWKIPIVITMEKVGDLDPVKTPVSLVMQATPQGPKIQMDVKIGDDPGTVNLQRHIVQAVYLEYSYRDRKIRGGEQIVLPASWLVAGAIETFRRRDLGVDTDLFARLVETNRMPTIEQFLSLHPESEGEAAQMMDGAYGMALLQLLTEQPEGRRGLAHFVRDWPDQDKDPVGALTRAYPGLGEGSAGLQKWWTLNIARFSAADRYRGLSMEETDRQLNALLDIELTVGSEGEKKTFNIAEFSSFLNHKDAKKALAARHGEVVALSAKANSLFRPVVRGYEEVLARLMRAKTRGVRDEILKTEIYRETVLHRMNDIADYLNWYEATQLGVRTNAFDGYLRAARAIEADDRKQPIEEEIQKYLDALEAQL